MTRTALPISGDISVEDFDPNQSLGSQTFWMVYTGTINLRRTRGPAINDFSGRGPAKLYEWDPSIPAWRLIAYKDPTHPPVCDRCGLTTFDHPLAGYRHPTLDYGDVDYAAPQQDFGEWAFLRKGSSRKLVQPLTCEFMCRNCRDAHG